MQNQYMNKCEISLEAVWQRREKLMAASSLVKHGQSNSFQQVGGEKSQSGRGQKLCKQNVKNFFHIRE